MSSLDWCKCYRSGTWCDECRAEREALKQPKPTTKKAVAEKRAKKRAHQGEYPSVAARRRASHRGEDPGVFSKRPGDRYTDDDAIDDLLEIMAEGHE